MAWKYYDFEANWDKVYEVWQGDAVQDALEPHMKTWCKYDEHEDDGSMHTKWHRGDSYGNIAYRTTMWNARWSLQTG